MCTKTTFKSFCRKKKNRRNPSGRCRDNRLNNIITRKEVTTSLITIIIKIIFIWREDDASENSEFDTRNSDDAARWTYKGFTRDVGSGRVHRRLRDLLNPWYRFPNFFDDRLCLWLFASLIERDGDETTTFFRNWFICFAVKKQKTTSEGTFFVRIHHFLTIG